jgi:lycopene cyclase domain-containing protein
MGAYTVTAIAGCVAVLGLEVAWLRTGLLRRRTYWIGYAIVLFFQCLVDGWLTKLSAPVVLYDADRFGGIRFPLDIPLEDFAFGWAMCTLALLLWERQHDPTYPEP